MSSVDPTKPPPPVAQQPDPSQLISAFWQAKQARDYWAAEEKRIRLLLADMYCADAANGGYKSRTLDVGAGTKLTFSVTRTLKVDTQNPLYLAWHKQAPPEQINKLFKTKPATLEPSMTGYNSMLDTDKAAIAAAISFGEAISANFSQDKDER